jgi:hypothetical protein
MGLGGEEALKAAKEGIAAISSSDEGGDDAGDFVDTGGAIGDDAAETVELACEDVTLEAVGDSDVGEGRHGAGEPSAPPLLGVNTNLYRTAATQGVSTVQQSHCR